jgi:hypothetical protein
MSNKNKTIRVITKEENEWIEKLKVEPTIRIDLDSLSNDSLKTKKKEE